MSAAVHAPEASTIDPDEMHALAGVDVAYVVQRYPKVSHVFILREVRALRAAGARIDTYSLRRAGAEDVLTGDDRDEARRTDALRPVRPLALVGAHVRALRRARRDYVATLGHALAVSPSGIKSRVWQLCYFGQAILLAERLRRGRPRHVHAHLANVAADVAWLAVDFLRRGPERWTWSFTMHGPTEFHDVRRFNLARKTEAADLVVCISDFCRSQLMAISRPESWSRLHVVHCGVDVDRVVARDHSDRRPGHLLAIGRLVPEKAHGVLLEAIAMLVEHGHVVTATVVGDGPEREHLLALRASLGLDHTVELTGALGQDDLAPLFDRADLFVLPSFDEGVPVVLMEAMARGLPVVATRITGVPELVDDGISGLLVPPGRADLLAAATARLLDEPHLRSELVGNARATIERDFDVAAEALRLGALFGAFREERVAAR